MSRMKSFTGGKYQVQFYGGEYSERQRDANEDGVSLYVEQHMNGSDSPKSEYTVVIVADNASETSEKVGRAYANRVGQAFGVPLFQPDGLMPGGFGGRGNNNLAKTHMPAILLESLFASNPVHTAWMADAAKRTELANCLVDTIKEFFPDGASLGFSVGHKYKTSKPNDRGVSFTDGRTEADVAEQILIEAAQRLTGAEAA